jgi:integrase
MPRRVKDSKLQSRAAREKLKQRSKPYYAACGRGLHLGYRKGKQARPWFARVNVGQTLNTKEPWVYLPIGTADDFVDANGESVLDFWQAQERARELFKNYTTEAAQGERSVGPYTVSEAAEDYLSQLGDGERDARQRLFAHLPPSLRTKEVNRLTPKEISAWLRHMASAPPRVRTGKGKQQAFRAVDFTDPEVVRCRRYSANKVLAQLKAALNYAFTTRTDIRSDTAWRKVKPFKGVSAARVRYFTIKEAGRLLNASDKDFRPLVRAALESGCRYGELARLKVGDFDSRSGTLLLARTKVSKPRHVFLTEDGQAFFSDLTAGRSPSDRMFSRQWKKSEQRRPMLAACKAARIDPPAGFHVLRHTWASLSVMNGVPLLTVAKNLGHSDTRMVELHYGHLAPSYVADAIRAGAPRYGVKEQTNVRSL